MGFVIIWILFGIVTAVVASNKGRNGWGWFFIGVLLGPFGLILALVISPVRQTNETKSLHSGETKRCPNCAEPIRPEAIRCGFCGTYVSSPTKRGETITFPEKR